jgi:hypothetical protein
MAAAGMRPDYRGKEWKTTAASDPPRRAGAQRRHDKISMLIDTDGDGGMDKERKVFYEGSSSSPLRLHQERRHCQRKRRTSLAARLLTATA